MVPENASALIALCGSLYRMADDINLGAIVTYATRLRREIGEFLVGSCIRRDPGPAALARLHPLGRRPHPVTPPFWEIDTMDLTHDAMLVSLRISAWSGRLYDRKASNHVAVHHEASASAGRYNKCLLPKAAFAALTATMSKARSSHYEQTLPWDDQGSRLLTVSNYEHYMALLDRPPGAHGARTRPLHRGLRGQHRPGPARPRQAVPHRGLSVARRRCRAGSGSATASRPVPDADHFMAKLASDDTDRVKRDIEHQVEERLHDAVGEPLPASRRGRRAGRRSACSEDGEGKPLVFRDSMIENIRGLVDVVPRLNIFGDDQLARLCEQVKEKIASVEPDSLRPSRAFDPAARARVKRDADALMEQFAGYFGAAAGTAAGTAAEPDRKAA